MWTLSWPPPKQALQSTPLIRIALRLNPPSSWTRQNQSESKPLGASALVGCHVLCSQETNNPLAVLNASNQQHFRCTPWNTPSVLLRSGACALSFSTWLITNKKQCDIWPSLWLYDMSRHGCISLQNNSTVTLPKSDFKQVWLKSLSSFSLFFSSFFYCIVEGNCRNIMQFCKGCFFLQAPICCFSTPDSRHAAYGNTSSHGKEVVFKWMEI